MDTHFKKEDPHEKGNYRPIAVQVTLNKLFEQLLSKQLSYGFNNKLCGKLTAYRKNNSCERALLSLTKNWKFALDEYNVVGVLSMDMSKAFDSLYHPLTLAKLKAYGVEERSLRLMGSYLESTRSGIWAQGYGVLFLVTRKKLPRCPPSNVTSEKWILACY